MRKFAAQRRRMARLEAQRPQQPTNHVCIYDAGTGATLNGPVPDSAEVVIYIPHNFREELPPQ
jgi:hypothetical protein